MSRSDVEIYRQPHTDRWIAQCWESGCGWQMGADGAEQKSHLLEDAIVHAREHRPLLDRDAVFQILRQVCLDAGAVDDYAADHAMAEVMKLARPMPTREQIAPILHDQHAGHEWGSKGCVRAGSNCAKRYLRNADDVLALLNGAGPS